MRTLPCVINRAALWMLFCLAGASAHAVVVTDDRGVAVQFTQTPQRVVSLLPSLTESVCALAQCQRLVGVDRYSNYPASIRRLPVVGGGLDPNIEKIVALKPDVVLLAASSRAGLRLESLGIKVVALEPKTHADVRRVLQTLGRLLGVPEEAGAGRVWQQVESAIVAAAKSLPASVSNTHVYFEVGRGPYAASESSFIGQTLARLGVKNIVPASLGPFPQLNPEFVVRANPDVIMLGGGKDEDASSSQAMAAYPGWSGIKAVRERRICVFNQEHYEAIVRAGPRMAEAAHLMARCLQAKAP